MLKLFIFFYYWLTAKCTYNFILPVHPLIKMSKQMAFSHTSQLEYHSLLPGHLKMNASWRGQPRGHKCHSSLHHCFSIPWRCPKNADISQTAKFRATIQNSQSFMIRWRDTSGENLFFTEIMKSLKVRATLAFQVREITRRKYKATLSNSKHLLYFIQICYYTKVLSTPV